ncbi:alkyl hydroperoxide reductase, partial [Vibrio parahaemolyticus]
EGTIQAMEITAEGIGRDAEDLLRKVKAAQYVAAHPAKFAQRNGKKAKRR